MSGRANSRSPTPGQGQGRSQTPSKPSRQDARPTPGQGRSRTPSNPSRWDKQPSGPHQNPIFSLLETYTRPTVYQTYTRPEQRGNPLANVGDSARNIDAIDKLSRYGNISHFFFVAGHSCMTTTSEQPPELIKPVCPNIFLTIQENHRLHDNQTIKFFLILKII